MDCRCSNIEDDDSNFTRFLLLARKGLGVQDREGVKCKTSIVFTLEETPGALYKGEGVLFGVEATHICLNV